MKRRSSEPKPMLPAAWPACLSDNAAIASYVSEHSPYDVWEEQIEEMYIGCRAQLRWTALADLQPGPDDANLQDDVRQAECDERPTSSMPPLLVDDGQIMDGNHRYRSLRRRGLSYCWAYHVEEIPEPTIHPQRHKLHDEGPSL